MQNQKLEIAEIRKELGQLAQSGILRQRAADACIQAASLLERMREVVLTGPSRAAIVEKLKWILVEQGEG
jgi:hypothetical protein